MPCPNISHIIGMGKATNFKLSIPTCAVTFNLKVLVGSSSRHLQGAGHIVAAALQVAQHG